MSRISLPDCSRQRRQRLLSKRQRREAIRALASGGEAGLEAWLEAEAQRDPGIRERVAAQRQRLERQAKREKRRIETEAREGKDAIEDTWESERQRLTEQREALMDRLASTRSSGASTQALAQRSDVLRAAVASQGDQDPPGVLDRVKRTLLRVWLWLVGLWSRFVRWLRGQEPETPRTATIELPDGHTLDLPSLLAGNPELRVEVRQRMTGQGISGRLRALWQRLIGREDYVEVAEKLMREELESAREAVEVDKEAEVEELETQVQSLEKERRKVNREHKDDLEELQARRQERLDELEEQVEMGPYRAVAESVEEELAKAGLVDEEGRPTQSALEHLANMVYEEARRALPQGGQVRAGTFAGAQEAYERQPMRSLNERGAMDLVSTVVRARQNHPHVRHIYDDDVLVHREIRADTTHVVLILDRSGSMEEKGRFEAAKRACLTMYKAVQDHDPSNRIDILTMSTDVERVDLAGAWNAELGGFTNHPLAIQKAHRLLEAGGADRKLVYLVTDGLPEAYPTPEGNKVDKPDVCLPHATRAARDMAEQTGARLVVIQLETEDPMFLEAAGEIAEAAGGHVEALRPEKLTEEVLLDFEAAAASG